MLNPDRLRQFLAWMERQPEMNDGWLNFSARSMLMRMWKEHDDEVAALHERVRHLELVGFTRLEELKDDDTLVIHVPNKLTKEQRTALVATVESAIHDPKKRVFLLDHGLTFVILRGARAAFSGISDGDGLLTFE